MSGGWGRLVGLGGYAESGKDAVAAVLEKAGWQRTYMSEPLERALLVVDPWCQVTFSEARKMAGGGLGRGVWVEAGYMRYSELWGAVGYELSKNCADVRGYLQRLGTEVGREMFAKDVWVQIGFRRIDAWLEAGERACITGVRFQNETEAVRSRGGLLVWVDRGGEPVNSHSSDNTLGAEDFDLVVENKGDLLDLEKLVLSYLEV